MEFGNLGGVVMWQFGDVAISQFGGGWIDNYAICFLTAEGTKEVDKVAKTLHFFMERRLVGFAIAKRRFLRILIATLFDF